MNPDTLSNRAKMVNILDRVGVVLAGPQCPDELEPACAYAIRAYNNRFALTYGGCPVRMVKVNDAVAKPDYVIGYLVLVRYGNQPFVVIWPTRGSGDTGMRVDVEALRGHKQEGTPRGLSHTVEIEMTQGEIQRDLAQKGIEGHYAIVLDDPGLYYWRKLLAFDEWDFHIVPRS